MNIWIFSLLFDSSVQEKALLREFKRLDDYLKTPLQDELDQNISESKESSLTATAWHWQTATCYQSCTSSRWYASVVYRHTHTQASIKLFHFKYIIMMCSFLFGFVGCCQEVLQFWDSCSVHWCVALPGECTWERRVQPDLSSWHWNWENLSECGQEELNFRLLRS